MRKRWKSTALGCLVFAAAVVWSAAPAAAAGQPEFVVWAGGFAPGAELHGVQLRADGTGETLLVDPRHRASGKLTVSGGFAPSPSQLAAIRAAAAKAFGAPSVRTATSPSLGLHGGYASAVIRIGGKTRALVGFNTSSARLHALLAALNQALPEADRLQAPETGLATASDGPTTSACPPGQGPTSISRHVSLQEAAQLGVVELTSKGGYGGDVVAVDAKWKPTGKPVTVRINIEFTSYPGGPSAGQVEAAIQSHLPPRIASDGTKVRFDVVARERAPGAPPSPCFHEIQLSPRHDFRDSAGEVGSDPLVTPQSGEWSSHRGAEDGLVWTHEALHLAGLGDRYREYFRVGKELFPLPEFGTDKELGEWEKAHRKELLESAAKQKLTRKVGEAIPKAWPGFAHDIMGTGTKLLQIDVDAFAVVGAEELTIEARPGDLLLDKVASGQNLAVGAPFEVTVEPGKDAHVDGMVAYCVDLEKHSPEAGQGYDVLGPAAAQPQAAMAYVQRVLEVAAAQQPGPLLATPGAQDALWVVTNENFVFFEDQAEAEAILARAGVPGEATFETPHFTDPNGGSSATAAVTPTGVVPAARPTPFVRVLWMRPVKRAARRGRLFKVGIVVAGGRARLRLELQRRVRAGWRTLKRFGSRRLRPGKATIRLRVPSLPRGSYRLVSIGRASASTARLRVRGHGPRGPR